MRDWCVRPSFGLYVIAQQTYTSTNNKHLIGRAPSSSTLDYLRYPASHTNERLYYACLVAVGIVPANVVRHIARVYEHGNWILSRNCALFLAWKTSNEPQANFSWWASLFLRNCLLCCWLGHASFLLLLLCCTVLCTRYDTGAWQHYQELTARLIIININSISINLLCILSINSNRCFTVEAGEWNEGKPVRNKWAPSFKLQKTRTSSSEWSSGFAKLKTLSSMKIRQLFKLLSDKNQYQVEKHSLLGELPPKNELTVIIPRKEYVYFHFIRFCLFARCIQSE